MNRNLFYIIVSLLCLTVSMTASGEHVASHLSKPIIVKASSPEATFSLPSNPTTGYSWFVSSYVSNLVMPMQHKFQRPKKSLMGAPGVSTWVFHINKSAFIVPTITKITMVYGRPWDLSDAKTKVITLVTQ